jgi:hypothetical protein
VPTNRRVLWGYVKTTTTNTSEREPGHDVDHDRA